MTARVWAVIRREYLERVRTKWFVLSTVGGPLLLAAVTVGPILFASNSETRARELGVLDRTGVLADRVVPKLEEAEWEVERIDPGPDTESELTVRVLDGDLAGYLLLDASSLNRGTALLRVAERPGTLRRLSVYQAVFESALEERLSRTGTEEDAQALLEGGSLELEVLGEESVSEEDPQFLAAFMGAFLLYFVILLYSQSVLRAVLEEKTGRVVEIIVASLDPWELMLGKILGVGAVGLTQLAVWVASGVILATLGLPALMASNPAAMSPETLAGLLPGAGLVSLFVVFFVLGYFLYSACYAAVGAMCSSEQEAQQAQMPLLMLLIPPMLVLPMVISAPGSTLSVALSLFPFFAPMLVVPRMMAGGVPAWQVVTALAGTVLAILAVAWIAGRIYRVGILMQGKRPTLPELWRWVREG